MGEMQVWQAVAKCINPKEKKVDLTWSHKHVTIQSNSNLGKAKSNTTLSN